jgi:hypothetical protein
VRILRPEDLIRFHVQLYHLSRGTAVSWDAIIPRSVRAHSVEIVAGSVGTDAAVEESEGVVTLLQTTEPVTAVTNIHRLVAHHTAAGSRQDRVAALLPHVKVGKRVKARPHHLKFEFEARGRRAKVFELVEDTKVVFVRPGGVHIQPIGSTLVRSGALAEDEGPASFVVKVSHDVRRTGIVIRVETHTARALRQRYIPAVGLELKVHARHDLDRGDLIIKNVTRRVVEATERISPLFFEGMERGTVTVRVPEENSTALANVSELLNGVGFV